MSHSIDHQHIKEVHAYAGLALMAAQNFEMTLENILIMQRRLSNQNITLAELESFEQGVQLKTLGSLLCEIRKQVSFGDGAEKMIIDAHKKRNFLAHRFFKQRVEEVFSEHGRNQMISELKELLKSFENADLIAVSIMNLIAKLLGITEERIGEELHKFKESAKNWPSK